MSDLISREALKKALKSNCDLCHDKNTNWCEHCCPLNDFEDLIDNAPTVYPICEDKACKYRANERPQGEWIYDERLNNWKCSECGETPKTIGYVGNTDFMKEHFKFCNHCGANMRKGGAE